MEARMKMKQALTRYISDARLLDRFPGTRLDAATDKILGLPQAMQSHILTMNAHDNRADMRTLLRYLLRECATKRTAHKGPPSPAYSAPNPQSPDPFAFTDEDKRELLNIIANLDRSLASIELQRRWNKGS